MTQQVPSGLFVFSLRAAELAKALSRLEHCQETPHLSAG
jgi:hypothetical protein